MTEPDLVRCTRCNENLPRSEYSPQSRKTNGLSSWCKGCSRKTPRKKAVGTRKCPGCDEVKEFQLRQTFCSRACINRKKPRSQTYAAGHQRIAIERGKAPYCVFGDDHRGPFQWANLMGDFGNIEDYASMCVRCHVRFDHAQEGLWERYCKRGHLRSTDNEYVTVHKPTGRLNRQCKQCVDLRSLMRLPKKPQ